MIKLFSSDIDGTLLGKPDAVLSFKKTWESIPESIRPNLCYNSGRLLKDTLEVISSSGLPSPEYLICGVGTVIYDMREQKSLKEFTQTLILNWDIAKVEEVASRSFRLAKQPAKFQTKYKSSWYWVGASPEELSALKKELQAAGMNVNVIYSSSRDLDIIPEYANKGNSLSWLLNKLSLSPGEALVAGDSGNDSSMFMIPDIRGIIVENAQPELFEATVHLPTFVSLKPCADGVLEGLLHFGVIQSIETLTEEERRSAVLDPGLQYVLHTQAVKSLNAEETDFIQLAYEKAIEALKKNITPIGFSACSLTDNAFHSTDVNYKSVWGRDGAITIIGSLSLKDDDIQSCQRSTLVTLLSHISPTGLVPSNVRIDDEMPDYSGVGGIASVDSGIWVIIAFYYFIRATRDYGFLRSWFGVLQKIMDRLSALDSNNDSLLEIPEAGDWTDLFGRSYNVLYDEAIWYAANLCFGRLAELSGDYQKAADYLRWTQTIKETITRKFWPTLTAEPGAYSFAEQQYTLGDTSYLLAEISPFNYDWRCDVYANILASLFNVLDIERSKIAFKFMWGAGVNEPYPVVNLYPPVNAGDPGWRRYYTVNLLNLPYHYHNGGIWPFIGAAWVRFLNRLGLNDLALRELYRLALLNKLGVSQEWEFNEWAHGKTGRPMGKAFQAWSAAGFIHAFHDVMTAHISTNAADLI